jgi:hypothetical protein
MRASKRTHMFEDLLGGLTLICGWGTRLHKLFYDYPTLTRNIPFYGMSGCRLEGKRSIDEDDFNSN